MGRRIVIVGNGRAGTADLLPEWVRRADRVIAADGGYAIAVRLGLRADLVVGDLDSLDAATRREMEARGIEVELHPREKDASDLELALERALRLAPERIALVAAVGSRLDHSLAGVFLLEKAAAAGVPAVLIHGREWVYLVRGEIEIEAAQIGDLVSLIPLSQAVTGTRTQGLRYPLRGETLDRAASRGMSNIVVSLPARVSLAQGSLLLLHHVQEVPSV